MKYAKHFYLAYKNKVRYKTLITKYLNSTKYVKAKGIMEKEVGKWHGRVAF